MRQQAGLLKINGHARLVRIGLAAAIALSMAAPVQANLLTNGSFETPVVTPGTYTNFTAGSVGIIGWTVVGVDSAITSGTFAQNGITFNAQQGAQWLDLAGVTSNSMSSGVTQTIATVSGSTYEVSFYVGSATDGSQFFASTVDLSINGGARVSYSNPTAPRNSVDWERFTADFVATGGSTTITFLNGDQPDNFMTGLDNASVDLVELPPPATGVPEPHALALVGMGLLAIASQRRRRFA